MRDLERRSRLSVLVGGLALFAVLAACGSSSLLSDGASPDAGGSDATAIDGGGAGDAADAAARDAAPPIPAVCPPQMARTGELTGKALDRETFGCYGACGPACKAACLDDQITTTVTAQAADGASQCLSCTYTVKTCKSHAFCRWHDDCYRQCDLRWDGLYPTAPPNDPSNPCYINCDQPVIKATVLCGEDWTQLTNVTPSIRDSCWDGSFNSYSTLLAQTSVPGVCGDSSDARPRPWAPDQGTWTDSAVPPATPPDGYSCTNDTDCPDRNQVCQAGAGTLLGLNGSGLCVDAVPSPKVDVTPVQPAQTWLADSGLPPGVECHLGYECASGKCTNANCAP